MARLRNVTQLLCLLLTFATVYHPSFEGKQMANQDVYHHDVISCAHNAFPLGTVLQVSSGKRSVTCEVTDRLSKKAARYKGQWVVDLSGAAWDKLTDAKPGRITVKVKVIHE